MIDSLVKCIILYDDKLVITFNFKNESVTVPTSDELEAIEDGSDIEAFASPKGKDRGTTVWVSLYLLCVNTYFDTFFVHLLKMRTLIQKCVQLN